MSDGLGIQIPSSPPMGRHGYHFRVGAFRSAVLNDFTNTQPFSELIIGVPEDEIAEALRREGYPTEEARLDSNLLLIRTGEHIVLVDSGWGPGDKLLSNPRAEMIEKREIDIVVITHTDSDHIGGLLDEAGDLTFPDAHYIMARAAWNRWTSDAYLAEQPHQRANAVRRAAALMRNRIDLIEVGAEVLTGMQAVDGRGHREGHIALIFSSGQEQLLHVADAVLHPVFITHPTWHSGFDSYPSEAAETRKMLLSRAAQFNMLVASAHLPFPGLGRVKEEEGKWLWQPIT